MHGRRSRGDRGTSPPRIWSGGNANANCPPPQILSYRYKNEHSVAFKIRQNPFSAWALPRTPLGELTTLPQTLVGWTGDTPPHTLPHSARTHHRRSPCVPQKSSQIYAYAEMSGKKIRDQVNEIETVYTRAHLQIIFAWMAIELLLKLNISVTVPLKSDYYLLNWGVLRVNHRFRFFLCDSNFESHKIT